VNALELLILKPFLQGAKRLCGHEPLLGGNDPNNLAFGLKTRDSSGRAHILAAAAADNLAALNGIGSLG